MRIGQAVFGKAAEGFQRLFHIGTVAVCRGNNKVKVFARDFFISGNRTVNQRLHLTVHAVKINRGCHNDNVSLYHLVQNFGHIVVKNAFMRRIANAAAVAIADFPVVNENLFNLMPGLNGAFDKLVTERVGISAFAEAGR